MHTRLKIWWSQTCTGVNFVITFYRIGHSKYLCSYEINIVLKGDFLRIMVTMRLVTENCGKLAVQINDE